MNIILGIDTSCDDTSCGIVEKGRNVLSSVVSSQDELHSPFGGIVPEIASRAHIENIALIVMESMKRANIDYKDIDGIAITQGPGLPGSLLVGWEFGKTLSFSLDIPFIGINHLEAHLFSPLLDNKKEILFPSVGLVVSGGHTLLSYMEEPFKFSLLGETRDDACGEALDKIGKILGLPYPGGPYLEKLSEKGDSKKVFFPTSILPNTYDFSFSGIKTHALRIIDKGEFPKEDIAASFQDAIIKILYSKLLHAIKNLSPKSVFIGGGVSANKKLRKSLSNLSKEVNIPIYYPLPEYSCDNGAMIAGLGYYFLKDGRKSSLEDDIIPDLNFTRR